MLIQVLGSQLFLYLIIRSEATVEFKFQGENLILYCNVDMIQALNSESRMV